MANSKYAGTLKGVLVEEVKSRRAKGHKIPVDLRADEATLAGALDADDMENGEFDAGIMKAVRNQQIDPTVPPSDSTELTSKELQAGSIARADGVVTRAVPDDLTEYSGEFRYRVAGAMQGHIFGLKVLSVHDVRGNKTHHAKSPFGFWDGTADEFRDQFDKVS